MEELKLFAFTVPDLAGSREFLAEGTTFQDAMHRNFPAGDLEWVLGNTPIPRRFIVECDGKKYHVVRTNETVYNCSDA